MLQIAKQILCILLSFWLLIGEVPEAKAQPALTGSFENAFQTILTTPIREFPPVPYTELLGAQLSAINASLPGQFEVGEMLSPDQVLMIGSFDLLGLPDQSLNQLGSLTGIDPGSLSVEQLQGFLAPLTPNLLTEIPQLNLADLPIHEVPLLQARAFTFLRGNQLLPLPELSPEELSLERINDIFQQNPVLQNISVGNFIQQFSGFGNTSITGVDLPLLQSIPVSSAIPGLANTLLSDIPTAANQPLASLGAMNVSGLSLSQFPNPLSLLANLQTGIADVGLGTPRAGDREQKRVRVLSGGIPESNMKLVGAQCQGESCPHFEIATSNEQVNGAAWIDANGQTVPDGFGILCRPWDCKGVPGNHPFGAAVRLLIRNIDQTTGKADLALTFPICRRIPFIGRTCTPWIFPTPEGIKVGTVKEKDVIAFVLPGEAVQGDVSEAFSHPSVPEPAAPNSPTQPVPPPQPCNGGGACQMVNPLPTMSSAGIYSRFRRRRPRHNGVDIQSRNAAPAGFGGAATANAPVVSPADGVVIDICPMPCGGYGNYVEIQHPGVGISTVHAHLYRILVRQGQRVRRGEQIGIEGGSGYGYKDYGIHNHFEVKVGGARVDPEGYRFTNPPMIPPQPRDGFG